MKYFIVLNTANVLVTSEETPVLPKLVIAASISSHNVGHTVDATHIYASDAGVLVCVVEALE